ncbi:MAG: DUF4430 domain-containing protein [Erysipelotrichaceae bacterium]|nr:DUF4430 domain-containing protein [Erysipelotrichaceae bacterium]
MKKILTVLLTGIMLLTLTSCFDNSKTVIIDVYGPNSDAADEFLVSAEVETLKDALDQLGKLGIFEYEYTKLSQGITILSINGIKADSEEGSRWDFIRNGEAVKESIDKVNVENNDKIEIRYFKEEKPVEQALVGDWVLFDKFNVVLTQDEKEVFEKATAEMLSVTYEPIRVIATQVVNGTNYAFLVSQSKVTANPVKEFYIVKIYKDLENNVDFKAINKLDPLKVVSKEDVQEDLVGGWVVEGPDNSAILLDENAQASFGKATEAYTGVNLQPVQLLASQLVNGTNYIALCKGQTVTENPINSIYVVQWHANLDGTAEMMDVKPLDIAYYTTGE